MVVCVCVTHRTTTTTGCACTRWRACEWTASEAPLGSSQGDRVMAYLLLRHHMLKAHSGLLTHFLKVQLRCLVLRIGLPNATPTLQAVKETNEELNEATSKVGVYWYSTI